MRAIMSKEKKLEKESLLPKVTYMREILLMENLMDKENITLLMLVNNILVNFKII
jgi:hypothetical protein